jgi:hypothetical protein
MTRYESLIAGPQYLQRGSGHRASRSSVHISNTRTIVTGNGEKEKQQNDMQ